MCGIAGVYDPDAAAGLDRARRMTRALSHRGPDDMGLVSIDARTLRVAARPSRGPALHLGHRRLSIVDLSAAAHQPMSDAAGRVWLVYNGEIYNFPELRRELAARGAVFRSSGDSEVLVQGYLRWGLPELLQRLRGMFAFAIADLRDAAAGPRLFLARDRLGIKPLYYRRAPGRFDFASEVRALRRAARLREDPDSRTAFLLFGYLPEPLTGFSDVETLPAGHSLIWEKGRATLTRWYEPLEHHLAPRLPRAGLSRDLRGLLDSVVRAHLVSDAPLGLFLSGGLDSSLLAALAARASPTPLRTISWDMGLPGLSEREAQRLMAARLATRHSEFTVSELEFIACADDAVLSLDLPSADGVNTYFVAREARRAGLKAVFSGLGADELFHGYGSFAAIEVLGRLQAQTRARRRALLRQAAGSEDSGLLEFLEADDPLSLYLSSRGLFPPSRVSRLLGLSVREVRAVIERLVDRRIATAGARLDPRDFMSYMECRFYLKGQLLKFSDSVSMRHSIELRVPYLDHVLFEWAARAPASMKLARGREKWVLLDAARGLLPATILRRPKQGFEIPMQSWLAAAGAAFLQDSVTGLSLPKMEVTRAWDDFSGGHDDWKRVWALAVLGRHRRLHAGRGLH